MRKKRSDIQKRKQILLLLVIIVFCLGVGVFFLWKNKENPYSNSFSESGRENVIRYNGKEYLYNDHLSNYLFLGIDSRDPVETYETQKDAGQADVIFLVSHDRVTQKLRCLVIPRDTMTEIEVIGPDGISFGMSEDHINVQYAFGDGKTKSCELMRDAVSHLLYQIPIRQYCSLNMDAIPIMAELVDGVELVVPDDSLQDVNPEFQKGATVTITGENAEQFIRYRDTEKSQSALVRMNRQIVFLRAYMEKVQELGKADISIATRLLDGVQPYMVTNMGNDHFVDLLEASMTGEPVVENLPGEGEEGEYFDEYRVDDDQLFELIIRMFYQEI